jgi:[ribosomal protein S18]-alanine N-acetyltransferase
MRQRVAGISLVVRPATATDVAGVVAIEREAFTQPWNRASFVDLVSAPEAIFLVADGQDGTLAAFAIAYVAADHSELANLAVAKRARGKGLGRHLLEKVMESARARGARQMFLEVRESNAAAQALYTSVGFHAVARRRHYYQEPVEDALVLRLDLSVGARPAGKDA